MSKPLQLEFVAATDHVDGLPATRAEVVFIGRSNVGKSSLLNAIALNTAGFNISRIIAPALGGFFIVAVGVAGNFGIQAALLVCVALASMPLRVGKALGAESRAPASVRIVAREMSDVVRHVWGNPTLRMLFGVQYVTLFFAVPFINFMPVWTTDVLLRDAGSLGVLYTVSGAGAIVGTLWLAQRGDPARRGLWLLVSVMGNAIGLIALSQVSGFALTLVLLAGLGAVQVIFFSLNMTAVQLVVPDAIQGRTMALYNLGHGSIALGTLAMGFAVDAAGVQAAMLMMGVPLLAGACPMSWARPCCSAPSLRRSRPRPPRLTRWTQP